MKTFEVKSLEPNFFLDMWHVNFELWPQVCLKFMVFTILSKCMVHLVTFSYIYHKNQANIVTHTMQYMDSKWVYTQIHPISITKFVRKIEAPWQKLIQKHRWEELLFSEKMVDFSRDPTVIPDISAFYQQKKKLKLWVIFVGWTLTLMKLVCWVWWAIFRSMNSNRNMWRHMSKTIWSSVALNQKQHLNFEVRFHISMDFLHQCVTNQNNLDPPKRGPNWWIRGASMQPLRV